MDFKIKEDIGKICEKAISLESKTHEMSRSSVSIFYSKKDKILKIIIKSKDLSAMRAAMNTYLRWLIICCKLIEESNSDIHKKQIAFNSPNPNII